MSKVIIFPTDTVYGIGTNLFDKEGIRRIYEIKGRDFDKPLAVLVSNLDALERVALISSDAKRLMDVFWPGALTIILSTTKVYYEKTGEKTIGVRMPNHPKALEIIESYGQGLFKTTSVNQSGMSPLNEYETIHENYGNLVDAIYPNDQRISLVSSTVVDLTATEIKVLRKGDITLDMILAVIRNHDDKPIVLT